MAIVFLVGGQILQPKDISVIGLQLAMYSLTVITGLLIHCFFTLHLIYIIFTRKNPFELVGGILEALTAAFGTSSRFVSLSFCLQAIVHTFKARCLWTMKI